MSEWSAFQDDVYLKGTLLVVVRNRRDGTPKNGKRVAVHACGYV
jgi:hypothetical protein